MVETATNGSLSRKRADGNKGRLVFGTRYTNVLVSRTPDDRRNKESSSFMINPYGRRSEDDESFLRGQTVCFDGYDGVDSSEELSLTSVSGSSGTINIDAGKDLGQEKTPQLLNDPIKTGELDVLATYTGSSASDASSSSSLFGGEEETQDGMANTGASIKLLLGEAFESSESSENSICELVGDLGSQKELSGGSDGWGSFRDNNVETSGTGLNLLKELAFERDEPAQPVSGNSLRSSALRGASIDRDPNDDSTCECQQRANDELSTSSFSVAAEVRMEPWGAVVKLVPNDDPLALTPSVGARRRVGSCDKVDFESKCRLPQPSQTFDLHQDEKQVDGELLGEFVTCGDSEATEIEYPALGGAGLDEREERLEPTRVGEPMAPEEMQPSLMLIGDSEVAETEYPEPEDVRLDGREERPEPARVGEPMASEEMQPSLMLVPISSSLEESDDEVSFGGNEPLAEDIPPDLIVEKEESSSYQLEKEESGSLQEQPLFPDYYCDPEESAVFSFPLSPSSRKYSGSFLETIHESDAEDAEAPASQTTENMVLAKRALLGIAIVLSSGLVAFYSHQLAFKWSSSTALKRARERRRNRPVRVSPSRSKMVNPRKIDNPSKASRMAVQIPKVSSRKSTAVHLQSGLNCRIPFAHIANSNCKAPAFDVDELVSGMLM